MPQRLTEEISRIVKKGDDDDDAAQKPKKNVQQNLVVNSLLNLLVIRVCQSLVNTPHMKNFLFRNYNLPPESYSKYPGSCTNEIWEVIRASTAAPGYYEDFILNNYVHLFVNIIRQLYEDATCQVIHDGKLTEPFTVRTGVRQGCILSPTIFLMVVDWVMRQATDGKRTGIQWTFSKQLEDLDFADDIALLSHKQQDAQEKLNRVAEEAEKTGLKINISKTEVMRVNHKQHDPIQLHQEDIKEVDKFIYLGSVVSKDGGTDEDIKSRTNKARHAFRTLRPIWRSTALSLRNKIRIFNSNVKSVLLYGSETWRTTKTGSHRLQIFINRCLRNILNIRYPLVITNQDLWEQTRQVPIEQEIKEMGMDRTHFAKANIKCHQAVP
nr:hypothetical protein BaRGS_031981 [Batillaria attramentaria]